MTSGLVVLVAALVLAGAVAAAVARVDGRFRSGRRARRNLEAGPRAPLAAQLADHGLGLGERATLLQFSSAFCSPCRATRSVLARAAGVVPGVAHVEIDAESHLTLVRELGIMRTPTTLVLDARGCEVRRAAGTPTTDDVLAALNEAVSP